uniref:Developmental pluripotency-associated 3 n=1 Tax=Cricetulus griseus TaxID=10029 RepID=A0A8C2LXG0_CRIGR
MEEPSEMLDRIEEPSEVLDPDEEPSEILDPDSEAEILAKDMKELTISPSAKKPVRPVRQRRRRHRISTKIIKPVENKSEAILRKVQSAFPRRQVRTLLSVQNDPIARMKRFIRDQEGEPFRCLCTFCLYQGWDPSENARIGKD